MAPQIRQTRAALKAAQHVSKTTTIKSEQHAKNVKKLSAKALPQVKSEQNTPASALSQKKYSNWSQHANSSPFPDFPRPTQDQCHKAHDILEKLHGDQVRENFAQEEDGPMAQGKYEIVMDALVVAAVSQATSWANAKRALSSLKSVYGSSFAYQEIEDGGVEKLQAALRPGGMQNRKAKILLGLLKDVKERHGSWDLQHLRNMEDEDVVKEVVSYWGIGPKCAYCLLSICLRRGRFAVDTHIYRLSGLWDWRPENASVELTQAHLDGRIPDKIKFPLHYQMIVHGRACPACRGGGSRNLSTCEFWAQYNASLVES